ncbi:helix-turn-helix domain-containing protein [Sphingomonas sp.]|uniref:helix-turn-helix domain-containing protein n=1 Tax=Sphingomonas sp. TaxID=28214 RepID=UPI0035C82478
MSDDYATSPQGVEAARSFAQVKAAMAEKGISQSELSRRSGYARSHISMLFNDRPEGTQRRDVTLPTALHLAHALGLVRLIDDEDR